MAIGVRDIANLEELLEVQDDDKIIVIQNGEAKLVSKANAKFGGGTVTVFYGETLPTSSEPVRLVDIDGNPISVQEVLDAFMSGPVIIGFNLNETQNLTAFYTASGLSGAKINGELTSLIVSTMKDARFYAGENPSGGVS